MNHLFPARTWTDKYSSNSFSFMTQYPQHMYSNEISFRRMLTLIINDALLFFILLFYVLKKAIEMGKTNK